MKKFFKIMGKNLSKTSSKSKTSERSKTPSKSKSFSKSTRIYNLSEIRERRKLSAKTEISLNPNPSSNFRAAGVKWISEILGNPRPFPPHTFGKVKPPKNFVGISLPFISFFKTSPKTSSKTSSKILPRISSKFLPRKKIETYQKVSKVAVAKPPESQHPCLFVEKLHQKTQEAIGSEFINKFTRLITKQGKKFLASQTMDKVRSILTGFEADKKNLTSPKSVKSDRKPSKSDQSQNGSEPQGDHKSPEEISGQESSQEVEGTDSKRSPKIETYKSLKLSQFLVRQNLKSLENSGKHIKNDGKSFKKNQKKKGGYSPLSPNILIEQAVSSVKPFVEVRKVRVAGSTYQVPAILEKNRQNNFAIKWILQSAFERHKKNPSQPLEYFLASEMYEASQKQGQARMKRNELHKLAESHRAFAHFRWW